jgi:hypothetical protein
MRPQAAGMSCYSVAEEITSVRGDFLVELRGFEPMAIGGGESRVGSPLEGLARPHKAGPRRGFEPLISASQASAREAAPPSGSARRNREARRSHRRLLPPNAMFPTSPAIGPFQASASRRRQWPAALHLAAGRQACRARAGQAMARA